MAGRAVMLTEAQLGALRVLIEEEPGGHVSPGAYPLGRERAEYVEVMRTARYSRYESTNGYVFVADVFTEVIEFSSMPDAVEIFVLDHDIELELVNVLGGKNESVTILANNHWEPGIVYRHLLARNLIAGVIGRIQVVAKWV